MAGAAAQPADLGLRPNSLISNAENEDDLRLGVDRLSAFLACAGGSSA
jgi:hypothetical protein